jgi:nucleotide-binding universal stress UspA family protein
MYKHILIATDGSELALKAVETGLALAKALNAKVSAVTVTEPWVDFAAPEAVIAFPPEEYQKAAAANASKILSAVTKAAERAGVTCETVHVADRYPADGIIEAAKMRGCDLIVMASHGRKGLARLLLGSQAMQVLTHSPVPVLICR